MQSYSEPAKLAAEDISCKIINEEADLQQNFLRLISYKIRKLDQRGKIKKYNRKIKMEEHN